MIQSRISHFQVIVGFSQIFAALPCGLRNYSPTGRVNDAFPCLIMLDCLLNLLRLAVLLRDARQSWARMTVSAYGHT